MTRINTVRVLLGGLAAGVVANACDAIIGLYLTPADMQLMLQRLGLNAAEAMSPAVAITWVGIDFFYALLIVFTYAAIRPRFGPGPKTAILAGLVIYAGVTSVLYGFAAMGVFTMVAFVKNAVLSAGTAVLTSLTGGYVYRES